MTLEVQQHIQQRLAAVIDILKNAMGQQAAKAYLTCITAVESLEFEPGAKLCDSLWMEYIDEYCMTNASDYSYPTPSRKIEEPLLHMTNSQTEADPCYPAPSPQIANPVPSGKCAPAALCDSCWEPKKHRRKGTLRNNTLDTVVRGLPRSHLLDYLGSRWETLKMGGTFAVPSLQVFTWTMEGSSEQVRRLHNHLLILRHLDVEDELH